VKTEKEFSESFVEAYRQAKPQILWLNEVQMLSPHYWSDLTSHLSSYFSNEDRLAITKKAATLLAHQSQARSCDEAWKTVLRNFNEKHYWNFQQISHKPKVEKTEEQKIFWKLFKYISTLLISLLVLKTGFYLVGMRSANNPDQVSPYWVWFIFGLCLAFMILFIYKNSDDKN
jgi:hypothetical protein